MGGGNGGNHEKQQTKAHSWLICNHLDLPNLQLWRNGYTVRWRPPGKTPKKLGSHGVHPSSLWWKLAGLLEKTWSKMVKNPCSIHWHLCFCLPCRFDSSKNVLCIDCMTTGFFSVFLKRASKWRLQKCKTIDTKRLLQLFTAWFNQKCQKGINYHQSSLKVKHGTWTCFLHLGWQLAFFSGWFKEILRSNWSVSLTKNPPALVRSKGFPMPSTQLMPE